MINSLKKDNYFNNLTKNDGIDIENDGIEIKNDGVIINNDGIENKNDRKSSL